VKTPQPRDRRKSMTIQQAKASFIALVFLTTTLSASERHSALHQPAYHRLAPPSKTSTTYDWQLEITGSPLLKIIGTDISYTSLKQQLTFPIGHLSARILEPLTYDTKTKAVLLPTLDSKNNQGSIRIGPDIHSDTPDVQLIDSPNAKALLTIDGARYVFVLLPNNEFRCVSIRNYHGISIDFLYTARDVQLHAIDDSFGRHTTFNYSGEQLLSITQTWHSEGDQISATQESEFSTPDIFKYAHASTKLLPSNALVSTYTDQMKESDKYLAKIFGGPSSVAAANGFEPRELSNTYPYYRGDVIGSDGELRKGHLSAAIHLYGSSDGTADSPIYLPFGFTSHSVEPTPVDAAVTFYYPQLGELKDVTIAIFHVRNFGISQEGNRVRIGEIGGPGGSSPQYKHAHIEFYKGDTGLPAPALRPILRITPNTIFNPRLQRPGALLPPNHTNNQDSADLSCNNRLFHENLIQFPLAQNMRLVPDNTRALA
jgi:hypothetical protein